MGVCQYCGRFFCPDHGQRLDDGQEVCRRSVCDSKRLDMIAFESHKAGAARKNESGACGDPSCSLPAPSECAKCHAAFCPSHLTPREIEEYRAGRTILRLASLCRFCDKRRKLWAKK